MSLDYFNNVRSSCELCCNDKCSCYDPPDGFLPLFGNATIGLEELAELLHPSFPVPESVTEPLPFLPPSLPSSTSFPSSESQHPVPFVGVPSHFELSHQDALYPNYVSELDVTTMTTQNSISLIKKDVDSQAKLRKKEETPEESKKRKERNRITANIRKARLRSEQDALKLENKELREKNQKLETETKNLLIQVEYFRELSLEETYKSLIAQLSTAISQNMASKTELIRYKSQVEYLNNIIKHLQTTEVSHTNQISTPDASTSTNANKRRRK